MDRDPEPIDLQASTRWAIASVSSKGALGLLAETFDLANQTTGRAHRLVVQAGGLDVGSPVTFSPESSMSGYTEFITPRPVNFTDFDGKAAQLVAGSAVIYSKTSLTIHDGTLFATILMTANMSGWGMSTPGVSIANGWTTLKIGDGKPLQPVMTLPPNISIESPEDIEVSTQTTAQDS
jgi:hypothetical protein